MSDGVFSPHNLDKAGFCKHGNLIFDGGYAPYFLKLRSGYRLTVGNDCQNLQKRFGKLSLLYRSQNLGKSVAVGGICAELIFVVEAQKQNAAVAGILLFQLLDDFGKFSGGKRGDFFHYVLFAERFAACKNQCFDHVFNVVQIRYPPRG